MMDGQQSGLGGLLGSYSSKDPSMNVPVTSSSTVMSPYLNIDPAYISPSPESQFIFPEGANHRRGRFEFAFSQIGGSVLAGAAFGGANGIITGIKETAGQSGPVKRTMMLNCIAKQGASSAQTLGVVALMYGGIGVIISKVRGAEDELNTLAAGTTTGLLFKSTAGAAKCVRGGAIGFSLAAVYCLLTSKDRLKQMAGMD